MVEVKSQENNTVKLPNNIRQIGTPGEKTKIYIEDYVMTYLNQMTAEKTMSAKVALLLGEKNKNDTMDIYFVSAAIEVVPVEWKEDGFKLSADEWTALYEKVNRYFEKRHMLGWFLSRPGQAATVDGQIEKIQMDNFQDKGEIFYTIDAVNREDAFYLYEKGHLFRQHGYYIYYERNEDMQNYMIEIRQEKNEAREGVPGFQKRLFEKKTDQRMQMASTRRKQTKKKMRWVPQVAILALILLAVGVKRNMSGGILPVSQNHVSMESADVIQEGNTVTAGQTEHLDIVGSIVQQAEQSLAENTQEPATKDEENQTEISESMMAESSTEVMNGVYKSYTVKAGDTLLKISRAYYQDTTHVQEIQQLNAIENPDYIYPGMVLKLP